MRKVKVAGAQIAPLPNDIPGSLAKVVAWMERAVTKTGAELIVFPESVTTGFMPAMKPEDLWDRVDFIPGILTEPICSAAKRLGVYVVFPTYERGLERGVVYNSAALIGPQGEIIGVYRKTHPFPGEQVERGGWSTAGTEAKVYDTAFGKVGMIICYDGDFPELSRVLAMQGAEIIVRPSAFLRSFDIWHLTTTARAYDNHVYVIAVNAVGTDAGNVHYFGNSMIVSPIAERLAQARTQEELIYAELDPDPLQYASYGIDSPMLFNHMEDRNILSYQGILAKAPSPFKPVRKE